MGRITLRQAARWCGGRVEEEFADISFLGANMDSRRIEPGQLFIALKAERDGYDFIPMAMEKGAAAVLCQRPCPGVPAIVVDDPRLALGDIARRERQRIGMKVVGVTGSVGKSTTKEMIACVLEGTYRVQKTPVNQNNDIGMPMAILGMPEDTEVAVLEMGMNHFREIAYLTSIARPDVGVIINIGTMHMEHLGSREGIRKAKLEILEGMGEDGVLILNGDDDMLQTQRAVHPKTRFFGKENPECHVRGLDVREDDGMLAFRAQTDSGSVVVELALDGLHYVSDALAAVSVGLELGVDAAKIRENLMGFQNLAGRQEIFRAGDYTIIKDCYNAGPESMKAALEVLGKRPGRHVAVLGDMLELGASAGAEHYLVGRIAAKKTQLLLVYGPNSDRVISGAVTGGMPDTQAMAFADQQKMAAALKRLAKPGDVILFKGSRGMHMERVLELFLKEEA